MNWDYEIQQDQMTSTLTCTKKYRLKINLKDIIDSQYSDQVIAHTCDPIKGHSSATD